MRCAVSEYLTERTEERQRVVVLALSMFNLLNILIVGELGEREEVK